MKYGKNFLERIAVARARIKMFAFASQSVSGEDIATIFLNTIVSMQEFACKHPAPFIAKIYRDGRLDMWKDHKMLMEELEQ
ncbi:hypothetical protein DSM106972_069020 [Dulcicalothrix desertica PCC 7102]|uniref:Uncharacterized protein n=1 Tax=Dulcicalothrix desertica PCC 7102 TaxID=232991 RepID=A0A3S1D0I5_9CYAN|nr:hypothetical protein [Dulcicalothrix desertica]RUT01351.1 hypothetical protein DSM106972_069020 [Dulcicalothrix desertica PCC 7102]